MRKKQRSRFVKLLSRLKKERPDLTSPRALVEQRRVFVGAMPVINPNARVPSDAPIEVRAERELRGSGKLRFALEHLGIDVAGRVALDVGASTGGFTRVLIDRGARRVYALDAGHGQLLGSLRQDTRVVNLESTNLGSLDASAIAEPVEIVSVDLSYLALARALPQLETVRFAPDARLIALVKPMFELGLSEPPRSAAQLDAAVSRVRAALQPLPWRYLGDVRSALTGARGAVEFWVCAARRAGR